MERKEENSVFKYATKELSQDAFICYLVNYCNLDSEYKKTGKMFIELLAEKIGNNKFKKYIKENDYKVEIRHQYKNMDILLKIDDFYIIIEDKIDKIEHDDQINKYKYFLINELTNQKVQFNENYIFTCYYKIYDEFKVEDKSVNCIITRKDMLQFLDKVEKKDFYIEDYYYKFLKEIEKYSSIRNITAKDINNLKSCTLNNVGTAVYTGFYKELEKKEKDIIGWSYADNRAGGTWWYASKKFNNVTNKDFDGIYAELNLKDDRNEIVIKLAKKVEIIILLEKEILEDKINKEEYCEKGKVKYCDKNIYYKETEKGHIEKITECRCYKNLKYKVDIFDKVITEKFLKDLEKCDICLNDKKAKGRIKKDNNSIYKYYTRIASINVNNYTLEEIEQILNIINKHLENIKIDM